MTHCIFHLTPNSVPTESATDEVHILLYGHRPVYDGTGAIGGQLRDLYLRFGAQPSRKAVDMVSIALAVTAADTFVRRTQAANAWSRDLKLVLPLRSPDVWLRVLPQLKRLLAFLSGDRWSFEFSSNGEAPPPMHAIRRHQRWIDVSRTDLVTLFSGGLDSTISTISLIDSKPAAAVGVACATGRRSRTEPDRFRSAEKT